MPHNQTEENEREGRGKIRPNEMRIANRVDLEEAGKAIKMNLILQICIGAAALVFFIVLRKKMSWMYCANAKRCSQHPAYSYTGLFNWVCPVLTIPDSSFFGLVGFDAFLFVETLKLLGVVFFALSVLLFPLLGGYYAFFGDGKVEQIFMRFSLLSTPENKRNANAIIPGIASWVVTFIVVYFFYMFYRKYVIMRQLHLRDRMFSKSIPSIRRLADDMYSMQKALDEIDIPSRSVLLRNLPPTVDSRHSLIEYLKYLNLGVEPVDCYVVTNTKRLKKLINHRKEVIYMLEKEIHLLFLKMNALSVDSSTLWQEIEGYDKELDLISNALLWEKREEKDGKKELAQKEVRDLVMQFFSSTFIDRLAQYSSRIKPEKTRDLLNTIESLNGQIEEERVRACSMDEQKKTLSPWQESSLYDSYKLEKEKPIFFSLRSLIHVAKSYTDLVQSIPKKTQCGFVTLPSVETTNSLRIALIGTGSFSCTATEAPAPREVIWPVLCDSEMTRVLKKFIASTVTFVFIAFFALFVFFVSTLININTFNGIVRWINPQLLSITESKKFRNSFQAIIVPSVYTFFLGLAPTALNAVCLFEGSISQIELQRNFGRKYSLFLFMNGFLALIFGATVISLLLESKKETKSIFEMISGPVVSSSIFFFNILIQKTFSATTLELLEPKRIFFKTVGYFLGGIKTRREQIEELRPEKINFGFLYSQIFLIFPMILIYTVICPIFFVFGTIYFFGQFMKYRIIFMYSHVSDLESGGGHWPLLCKSIFYSLITFQLINIAHFVSLKQYIILVFVVPLLIFTFGIWRSFQTIMDEKCNYLPSNSKELEEGAKFMYRIVEARKEEIKHWKEFFSVKKDVLDLTKKFSNDSPSPYLYKDLALFPASCSATLPRWFCTTLLYLKVKGGPSFSL